MERVTRLLIAVSIVSVLAFGICFGAGSDIYPWPTNWSLGGLASWSAPITASGAALPAVGSASAGDHFIVDDGASATQYRLIGGAWVAISGGSTAVDSSASLTAHIASQTDPHGASMTLTVGLTVGSGTSDTYLERTGTGTITLASYARILPTTATPSEIVATGTIWYDENVNKLKVYDGTSWNECW